jgi:spermidine synthase
LPLAFSDLAFPVPQELFWSVFRTAAAIVPFSALLGFLTPLLVDEVSDGQPDRAGRAYAVNIIGAILGPLLAGFVVLPWLGDHHSLAALSLPLFGIGLWAALPNRSLGTPQLGAKPLYATLVLASAGLAAVTKDIQAGLAGPVQLRDHTATVIATGEGFRKRLIINGVGMTSLTPITKYMAHLPLAFLDRQPQNGLVICFGMGTSFRSMLSWGIDTTVVELVPSVPKLFGYYHPDGPEIIQASALDHIVIDDGRRFLERSAALYDVITLDPPPPITTPTTSLLYSREFYQLVRRRLRSAGIFHAWLAVRDPGWDIPLLASFSKALRESFPHVRAFPSLHGTGIHFLASEHALPTRTAAQLAARLPVAAAADLLEWGPFDTSEEMFAEVLKTEQSIARLAAMDLNIPPLQDDRPVNEYFFLRRLFDPRVPLQYFGGPRVDH